MKIKHSKYKNTGILFELLIRQITADTLDGKDSPVKEILKKYFVKTELGKEYKLYEALLNKTSITETKANIVIDTLLESSRNINKRTVKKQRYNLISEIQKHYNLNEFFNHKLPNYKTQAAFYTLLEAYALDNMVNPNVIITNKVTILEHLTAATITEKQVRDNVLDEFKKSDKDLRTLTYRIILEKFNGKYDELNTHQKSILKELINSIDNSPRLKEFYSSKSTEIREELTKLNKKVKDQVTKIKVNEIISLMKPLDKNVKVSDNDLINLLQYCDLVNELESANA
jgi:hypothetical protein